MLIDPPGPFAPKKELQDFLDQHKDNPDPGAKWAVRAVRGHLANYEKGPTPVSRAVSEKLSRENLNRILRGEPTVHGGK